VANGAAAAQEIECKERDPNRYRLKSLFNLFGIIKEILVQP
jgi:hypothetical protein